MFYLNFFFFFKQKTAYEIGVRLVGSEMCIRDSLDSFLQAAAGYNSADDLLDAMSDSITEYAREALLYQAVAEAMDIAPTQEQIDTYSAYTETYGANYCTMVALMDAVSEALTTGAQVK